VIIAHDNVRKRMLASPQDILRDYPARIEEARKAGREDQAKQLQEQIEWAQKVKVEEIPAPIVTFDTELRVHVNGETIQVWHTPPAHTDGDSSVYFEKANVLHMGDLFFNKVIPFIDVRSGGSPAGYLKALDATLARVPADVTIIPGHGDVTDVAGLKTFRQYIGDVIDAAKKAKAAGTSKDDFVKSTEMAAYKEYRGYPDRFRDNLGAAYDEVK
jgi:glyoxylase-like metal-dependent hydrolase (beta-lactamase superfamily II)